MSATLKPCAHCGGKAVVEKTLHGRPVVKWVQCNECGASASAFNSVESAIAAWNRRAGGWQDISAAPKDGTSILAVIEGRHPQTGKPYVPEVVEWVGDGWYNDNWGFDEDDDDHPYSPTHWMPCPGGPEAQV